MHFQNLKHFQNSAIYYLSHNGNDVMIPANLFSCNDLIVEFGKFNVSFFK